MPTFLLSKTFWIGLAVAVGIALLVYIAHGIYHAGGDHQAVVQADHQIKQNNKTRRAYAKIDKATPDGDDRAAAIKWLRNYTSDR